jgi:nucleoid-associated protein YgaU
MDKPDKNVTPKVSTMTFSDVLFLCFMVFVVFAVAFVGRLAYLEGMKTEGSKQNGEAIAAWFTQASADRYKDNFNPTECAAGLLPALPVIAAASPESTEPAAKPADENQATTEQADAAAPKSEATAATPSTSSVPAQAATASSEETKTADTTTAQNVPRTWGECLKYLTSEKGPWSQMKNPFNDQPLTFIEKCDPTNHEIPGYIVLESINPTPPGSAIPSYTNALASTDTIDKKMQLRVTICDKGSYPIPIADIEF